MNRHEKDQAFDRYVSELEQRWTGSGSAPALRITPYQWIEPASFETRDWLYGRTFVRKYLSATVAPGGVGKSSLIAAEAISMVSGKDLLGVMPKRQLRVWLWNLEDPQEETGRKIQAVAKHHGLTRDDLGDRLFVDSGRDQKLVIAKTNSAGAMIVKPVVDALVAKIQMNAVDVVIVDPFVSSHELPENDNTGMDMVAKEWCRVAERGNCAVHLVHHTKKGEQEVSTESARGAKAVTDACRIVRVVNRMSREEAEKAGVENHRLYFRTYNDKANLAPPVDQSDWFKLTSVDLGNGPAFGEGDSVGVVTPWAWPDPLDGMTGADFERAAAAIRGGKWRESPQAKDWVGNAVADALDIDISTKAGKAKVGGMIKIWLKVGSLMITDGLDEKRMPRKFVEVSDDA